MEWFGSMIDADEQALVSSRRAFLQTLAGLSLAGCLSLTTARAGTTPQRSLQLTVANYIKARRRSGRLAADERTAWSVYDFTTRQKLVALNENTPYQSASMIKPFIAQAYFYRHQENPRRYPYSAPIKYLMERMIRDSDNHATNELIDRISDKPPRRKPKDVERLLKSRARDIFSYTSIVEYIPSNGRAYRNKAAARDYSRFLYALWHQRLPFAKEVQNYMGLPKHDRIIRGSTVIPPFTQLYDKTGSTARLCGDMGIVVARGKDGALYPYTFIGIIEKTSRARSYGRWLSERSDLIREVSGLVYQALRERHPLV